MPMRLLRPSLASAPSPVAPTTLRRSPKASYGGWAAGRTQRRRFAGKLPADSPAHHPGYDYLHVGMLLKFPPEGGGIARDVEGEFVATAQYDRKNVVLRNEIWTKRLGYVGNHGHELGCHCETTRFDIARYDRIFMPDPFRFRVCVLDSEGRMA